MLKPLLKKATLVAFGFCFALAAAADPSESQMLLDQIFAEAMARANEDAAIEIPDPCVDHYNDACSPQIKNSVMTVIISEDAETALIARIEELLKARRDGDAEASRIMAACYVERAPSGDANLYNSTCLNTEVSESGMRKKITETNRDNLLTSKRRWFRRNNNNNRLKGKLSR